MKFKETSSENDENLLIATVCTFVMWFKKFDLLNDTRSETESTNP